MPEQNAYFYENQIEWKSNRAGELRADKHPAVPIGAPPEFQGHEGNWSPEQLFVASVNACYMLTLVAIAENSKLQLARYSSIAKGKLEKVEGAGFQITEVLIKPRIVMAKSQDIARVSRILEKAKQNCFITNSVKAAVKLEPEVTAEQS